MQPVKVAFRRPFDRRSKKSPVAVLSETATYFFNSFLPFLPQI